MKIDKIEYYQNGYIVAVSNRKYGILDFKEILLFLSNTILWEAIMKSFFV